MLKTMVVLLCVPSCAWGGQFLDNYLYYSFESGSTKNVYVSGYRNSSVTNITIPKTVIYEWQEKNSDNEYVTKHRTCNVTGIGRLAFDRYYSLTSISIPDTITSIGWAIFCDCTSLKSAEIPNSVINIGGSTFSGCHNLSSVKIPDDVTEISGGAFYGCWSLSSITIPNGVTSIRSSAFMFCRSLTNINIPHGVTNIGEHAFSCCYTLNNVAIPDGVKNIPNSTFNECYRLLSVDIPNSVTNIGGWAFHACRNLKNVKIPDNVRVIGEDAFYDCSSLTNVLISSSVKNIKKEAFYLCGNASLFSFDGLPPTVGTSAFAGVKNGAIGTYKSAYKAKWQAVIDSNGKWQGLIMREVSSPVLSVAEASIPYDTLKLQWSYPYNGIVKYSLYRNTEECLDDATLIASGSGMAGGTYTESDFMKITPQTSSLHYWLVTEDTVTGEKTDVHLEARRRFLLSVGYSAYEHNDKPIIQKYRNTILFRSLCVSRGKFTNYRLIANSSATTEKVRTAMANYAKQTQPGDLFVLYIDTHGGDYGDESDACLSTYDDVYLSADLQDDIRMFSSGTAIVGIISACHSKALTGGVNQRDEINEWLAKWGFAQCLGNVAWITSCDTDQNSWTFDGSATYTEFGYSFIYNGFSRGGADKRLYGTEYNGGNEDGNITLGEIACYAKEFSQGISDEKPSIVQSENEALLDRIVVDEGIASESCSRPNVPLNVNATKGQADRYVDVSWSKASNDDSSYRIYRSTTEYPNRRTWIDSARSFNSVFDLSCELAVHYQYQVQAIGLVGKSELSDITENSIGWRGTMQQLEFLDRYRPSSLESASYATVESSIAPNGQTYGVSYVAGLNPTNETSKFTASLSISNDVPTITWTPDLGSNRTYTIYGKENLTDPEWITPTNSTHKFFKVSVGLP